MDRKTAYRRGLCVECQRVKPAAGMTRCWPCHSDITGIALPPELHRQTLIHGMAGTYPSPHLRAIATIIADRLLALEGK